MLSKGLFLFNVAVVILTVNGQSGTPECALPTSYTLELRRLTREVNSLVSEVNKLENKMEGYEEAIHELREQVKESARNGSEERATMQAGTFAAVDKLESICNSNTWTVEQNPQLPSSCSDVVGLGMRSPSDYYCIQNASSGDVDAVFCTSPTNPATSCHSLMLNSPRAPSGHYWVTNTNGQPVRVYCAMHKYCCDRYGGWMWVANLDMANPSHQCPDGMTYIGSPRRCAPIMSPGCRSITYAVHGVQYSRVCGQVRGIQWSTPDAFQPYYKTSADIDGVYVDGVSITHGRSPRKHIWTFAAALDETRSDERVCPCNSDAPFRGRVPPFVGDDYFCETGSRGAATTGRLLTDDPLWDGAWCGPTSSCCQFNSPPWFCKELPQPTTDDIEVRVCRDEQTSNENIDIDLIQLYVQ